MRHGPSSALWALALAAALFLPPGAAGGSAAAAAADLRAAAQGVRKDMQIRNSYPLVTTPKLFEARDFYVRHFGFTAVFQSSWFVYLASQPDDDGRSATVAFMHPEHPSSPPGPEVFSGEGVILTIEVADAAAAHRRLVASGAPMIHPLTSEEWGQLRFMTRDPAGMHIDVVQQTESKPGYWERYPAPD